MSQRTPQADGIWRIDTGNTHVEQHDNPADGEWFIGYRSDGRAFVYDESTSTIRAEPCHADADVRAAEDTERLPCDEPSVEHWIREHIRRIAALHPRYYWLLSEGDE